MAALWRIILRPVLAFLGACAIAGAGLTLVFYVISVFGEFDTPITVEGIASVFVVSLLVGFYVAVIACVPAILLIWILHLTRMPRGWTDAIAGALVGSGAMQLMVYGYSALWSAPDPITLLFGATGLVAGFAYWLLAGRPKPPYGTHPA